MKKLNRVRALWKTYLQLDKDEAKYEKNKLFIMKMAILDEIETLVTR